MTAIAEVIAMSEIEKDYADYLQVGANLINVLALLSGFAFTAITILLSQYPNLGGLNSIASQVVLLLLSSLFFLFMWLLVSYQGRLLHLCRRIPPVTKELAFFNRLINQSYLALQFVVVVMFLVWSLFYLALATGIVWAIFTFLTVRIMRGQRTRAENENAE